MSDPRRLLAEARAAADRGDPAAALAAVDRLLAVAGEEAGAQRESGLLLAALGRPAAARSALERARSLDPGDAGTVEALARLALADRRVDQAVAGFRQAIRLDPGRAAAYVWLGRALLAADCPAEAVDAFESATRLDPEDPRGFQQLGLLYLQQGLHGSAVACLARAAALAPEAPGPQADLGLANQTAGDLDAAAHAYRKALALDSGHRAALRGLARIAEIRRRPEEGLRLLEPVVAAAAADGGLLAQHGALLDLSGRREEAISLLEDQLHRPFPDSERMEVGFRLAALYDAAGKHERAFHHAAVANRLKAVEFDPAAYRALIDRLLSANPDRRHAPVRDLAGRADPGEPSRSARRG
jgi:tetratricopeptide (TPR) repeat protein